MRHLIQGNYDEHNRLISNSYNVSVKYDNLSVIVLMVVNAFTNTLRRGKNLLDFLISVLNTLEI